MAPGRGRPVWGPFSDQLTSTPPESDLTPWPAGTPRGHAASGWYQCSREPSGASVGDRETPVVALEDVRIGAAVRRVPPELARLAHRERPP